MTAMEKLRTRRAVCMSQLTRLEKQIERLTAKDLDVIEYYEHKLDRICKTLEEIQSELEQNAGEKNLLEFLDYRVNFEDLNTKLTLKLRSLKKANNQVSTIFTNISPKTCELKFNTFNDELESFTNYLERFDNFIKLNNIKNDEEIVRIFLNSLSAVTYEKLSEFCSPKNPRDISYMEIQKILNENLEPFSSFLAKQYKFISRIQREDETIGEYCKILKLLSSKCKFSCNCGRSTVNSFLRLQFIRGIQDSTIRSELLQNDNLTFEELIDKAKLLEISKNNIETKEEKKLRKKQIRETYQTEPIETESENFSTTFMGRCYRCDSLTHKAYDCKFKNESCKFCYNIGHTTTVCRTKAKFLKTLSEIRFEESSDSDESL